MSGREGGRELVSYRGDTKTMTLSEDKGHGKNIYIIQAYNRILTDSSNKAAICYSIY